MNTFLDNNTLRMHGEYSLIYPYQKLKGQCIAWNISCHCKNDFHFTSKLARDFLLTDFSFVLACLLSVIKTWPKSTWGRKGRLSYVLIPVHHWGKSRQELKQGRNLMAKQRPWRNTVYWFILQTLVNSLSYISQEHQEYLKGAWTFPHQALIKKIPHRLACRHFLSWGSSSPVTQNVSSWQNNPTRPGFMKRFIPASNDSGLTLPSGLKTNGLWIGTG